MYERNRPLKLSNCSITDEEFICKLTLENGPVGSISFELEDGWIRDLVGLIWYASTALTCPDYEGSLLFPMRADRSGDLDPFAWREYLDEVPGFKCNLDTGWMERRDQQFNAVGRPLARLSIAQYRKHQLGATNEQRRHSSGEGDSQLRVEMTKEKQDYICDEVFGRYVADACEDRFRTSVRHLACDEPLAFLHFAAEMLPQTGLRIPVSGNGVIGYELLRDVTTLYLDISPVSGYHLYPATLKSGEEGFAY